MEEGVNMTVSRLCASLGIESYPEKFEELYEKIDKSCAIPYGEDYLASLESEYSLFGEHYGEVIDAYRELTLDRNLSLWCALAVNFVTGNAEKCEIRSLNFPKTEGSASDMMRLFVLASLVPSCAELYAAHGFSQKEILDILEVFKRCLALSKVALKRPGYKDSYYGWTLIYMFCEMFDYGSFNFQFVEIKDKIKLLKNKTTGECAFFFTEGRFHRDGKALGDAGFTDEEGAFDADFTESETEYTAHLIVNARVSKELSVLKKSEWETLVEDGDEALGLHIPSGVDFSKEAIDESLKTGLEIAKKRFPEYSPKIITCASWLLDPALRTLLGEGSRIVAFGERFIRCPGKASLGRSGFSFVFLGYSCPDSELPENTSLRRKLKKQYLDGGFTYGYRGFIVD